jgi:hypothetical protein
MSEPGTSAVFISYVREEAGQCPRISSLRLVLFAAMLVLAGCSTPPAPPAQLVSSAAGKDLRTVGIGFSAVCPDLLIEQTATSKDKAIVQGATSAGLAPALYFPIGLAAIPVAAAVGGLAGAAAGVSKGELAAAITALEAAKRDLRLHDDFARALLEKTPEISGHKIQSLSGMVAAAKARAPAPASSGESQTATPTAASAPYPLPPAGIDTVLRLRVLQCSLHGNTAINPSLKLCLLLEAQLIRVGDWSDAGQVFARFESGERPFTEWAAANARVLREEWHTAVDSLAAQTAAWLAAGAVPPPVSAEAPAPSPRTPST